jgi:hypothetical protein
VGKPLKHRTEKGRASPLQRSIEDFRQQESTEAAAEGVGKMLEQLGINRQIRTLSWEELQWIAVAAITGWTLKRAEHLKTEANGNETHSVDIWA